MKGTEEREGERDRATAETIGSGRAAVDVRRAFQQPRHEGAHLLPPPQFKEGVVAVKTRSGS